MALLYNTLLLGSICHITLYSSYHTDGAVIYADAVVYYTVVVVNCTDGVVTIHMAA
ncbi:MAG: hypothetical protein MJY90_01180 [Bacteroidaceae bacterium]|nr:hypothetical protein [Bacteroidaceae bacterium]